MELTIDEIFTQTAASDASRSIAKESQERETTEFPVNVVLAESDQKYLDFTAKQKDDHEIVFDVSYAMMKQDNDSRGMLGDVREFISAFSQFCELRLKSRLCIRIRPYTNSTGEQVFVYMTTFIDCNRSISKLFNILADVRSMQQRILRKENTESWPKYNTAFSFPAKLTGHSMSIQTASLLNKDGSTSVTMGKTLSLDGGDRFIDHVYEMKYGDDDYLREKSLKSANFNYTIDMIADDLKQSGIFGEDKNPIERDVREWMHKARLWKLEFRRNKKENDETSETRD